MIDEEINELEARLRQLEEMDPLDAAFPGLIKQIEHMDDDIRGKIEREIKSAISEAVQILAQFNTDKSRAAIRQMIEDFPEHDALIRTMASA